MTALAVQTTNLSKSYDNQSALDRVDLRVPEGSVYVMVGANGAGKSTTFKILMNLERPDSGNASVFGLDTGANGPEVRAHIGYVPESNTPKRSIHHGTARMPIDS
jgi:ABC-2 type transport system ATP-binding protein